MRDIAGTVGILPGSLYAHIENKDAVLLLAEPHRTRLREKRRSYESFFTRAVAAGVQTGEFRAELDVKVAVLGILGALNWTPEWFSPDGPATAEEIADGIAEAFLGGMLARS